MSYLLPVNKLHLPALEASKDELDMILTQEVMISQLSQGINYRDIEEMDEYERLFILKKLIKMKKDEYDAKKKAIEEAKNKR